MLILNQTETMLVEMGDIFVVDKSVYKRVPHNNNLENQIFLGKFATEERAKLELIKISEAYNEQKTTEEVYLYRVLEV